MSSREELLDHLLAMGFPERDCLAAIASCGINVDLAVSWLCERPSNAVETKVGKIDDLRPRIHSGTKPVKSSSSANTDISSSAQEKLDAAAAAKREKDHNEELRRINRAWNARAEEEKRKVCSVLHRFLSTSNL